MTKNQSKLLSKIEAYGPNGGPAEDSADLQALVAAGAVLAQDGLAVATAQLAAAETAAQKPAAKPAFEIEDNVPVPAITRAPGAGRPAKYPFDLLEKGQSFFVADEQDKPAIKFLASVCAQANARWSEEIPGEVRINRKGSEVPATKPIRKFVVRRDAKNGASGARVFRLM